MRFFKKAKTKLYPLAACTSGSIVPMKNIEDSVFRDGILGECIGIEPESGMIVSPCDGIVTQVTETSHAIGIKTAFGGEILIHAGIDTVQLLGEGFSPAVSEGEQVKAGQLILTCDLEKIREDGYKTTVITAVTNSADFEKVEPVEAEHIHAGEKLLDILV